MGLALQQASFYDNSGGLDVKTSPTKLPENSSSSSLNVDYTIDGAFRSRNGSTKLNATAISGNPTFKNIFDFTSSAGTQTIFTFAGGTIYTGLSSPSSSLSSLNATNYGDFEKQTTNSEELVFFGDGVNMKKWDGSSWTSWSITAPASACTAADGGAGTLVVGTFSYYVTFARTIGGVIVQESDLNTVASVTLAASRQVALTNIPTSADSQVNARVIYRRSPTSGGVFYRLTTIADNVTTTYADNTSADGNIEVDYDKQPVKASNVMEEYGGRMFVVDASNPTDLYYSPINEPFYNPTENVLIFDGNITCVKRIFGALVISTPRSLWVLNGDPEENDPRRISSWLGILNNRCAVGESFLYFLGSNKKMYAVSPTDFSQSEMRLENDLSHKLETYFNGINISSSSETPCMEYYSTSDLSRVEISVPYYSTSNDLRMIYNEDQSQSKGSPVWQLANNSNVYSMKQIIINNTPNLYAGDNYGFLWKMDDSTMQGDGAEISGTATSGGATTLVQQSISSTATAGGASTLTDSSLTMTVNQYTDYWITTTGGTGAGQSREIQSNTATQFTVSSAWGVVPDATTTYTVGPFEPSALVGCYVNTISGTGADQSKKITSNTNTTLTVISAWNTNPASGTVYTVGGFDAYHYTNWKHVIGNYEELKRLWYIWLNANASGSYNVTMIVQTDFDTNINNQTNVNVNLAAQNSIWGDFLWGSGVWGARSVFTDRFRSFRTFQALRIGIRSRLAGYFFQINGISISCQNKKYTFSSAA